MNYSTIIKTGLIILLSIISIISIISISFIFYAKRTATNAIADVFNEEEKVKNTDTINTSAVDDNLVTIKCESDSVCNDSEICGPTGACVPRPNDWECFKRLTKENYNPSCAGDHQICSIDHKCITIKGKCKGVDVTGCKPYQVCDSDGAGYCVYEPNRCDVNDLSKCENGETVCDTSGYCAFAPGKCDPTNEKSCGGGQSCDSNGDCYYPEGSCLTKDHCTGSFDGFDCSADFKCVPPSSWEC